MQYGQVITGCIIFTNLKKKKSAFIFEMSLKQCVATGVTRSLRQSAGFNRKPLQNPCLTNKQLLTSSVHVELKRWLVFLQEHISILSHK